MMIRFRLNGKQVEAEAEPSMLLLDLVRSLGCYSASVPYGLTESPSFHAPRWQCGQMDAM